MPVVADLEGVVEGLLDDLGEVALGGGEVRGEIWGVKVGLDGVAIGLDELELADGVDFAEAVVADGGPVAGAVGEEDEVALAAEDAADDGEAAAAGAGFAGFGVVADFVADEGGGEVDEVGEDDAAGLAGGAGLAVGVEDLEEDGFGDVVVVVAGALGGDDAGFLGGVAVLDGEAEVALGEVA